MKKWLWTLGLTSYLGFLIASLPAAVVVKLLPSMPGVTLGPAQGQWNDGRLAFVRQGNVQLNAIHWQLSLAQLWRGQLGFQLEMGASQAEPTATVQGRVGFSGLSVEQGLVTVPIRWVLPKVSLPMKMDASGDIVVRIEEFQSGTPYCTALKGQASWQDAKFESPIGWLDLQSITGALTCQQGNLQLITAANNPLGAALTVDLLASSYQINGTLQPVSSLPKEVHQAMQFVGPQDSQGRYVMKLAGQIRH